MDSANPIPFYIKASLILVGIFALGAVLFLGQQIILPLVYSFLIAILLNPVVNYLIRLKFNRIVAIALAVLFAILFVGALMYVIMSQLDLFNAALPKLKERFNELLAQIIAWVSKTIHVETPRINEWLANKKSEVVNNSGQIVSQTLTTVTGLLIVIFLVPVYVFLILFYQPLLLEFVRKLFARNHQETVADVLIQSKAIIQSYLVGLVIEAILVAILNSAGLLLLGIDYAILIGVLGALLNVIPYVGGIVAISMPVIIALVTKPSPTSALMVIGVYLLIQFIDNNYIVPRIVASRVKVNALIAIVVVIIGGALWGVPGMFLALPLTAVIKVIFDNIEPLKPWGFLLGDTMPPIVRLKFPKVKKK